jgi:hypothetical protein
MPVRSYSQGVDLFGGPLRLNRTATATSYTATPTDCVVAVTNTGAARTITLPSAAAVGKGHLLIVQDESGGAGTNNITIAAASGENVRGTATISSNYGRRILYSDGSSQWFSQ